MSDLDSGVTEQAPQNNNDDFKGIVVETNGEKVNTQSEAVVEANPEAPESEGGVEKPKRPGRWERQYLKQQKEIEELKALVAKDKAPVISDKPKEPPKEADYENVLDYLDAKQDYKVELALQKQSEQTQKATSEAAKQQEFQQKVESFAEREAKIIAENPDYVEDIADLLDAGVINKPMMEAIVESDVGEQVSLFLSKNPKEAALISQLPEKQMYRVLGLLEAHISGPKPETPPAPRQTAATAPIAPVRSNPASNATIDPSKDQRSFEKWFYKGK